MIRRIGIAAARAAGRGARAALAVVWHPAWDGSFSVAEHDVRAVLWRGQVWFSGDDVAYALGMERNARFLRRLCVLYRGVPVMRFDVAANLGRRHVKGCQLRQASGPLSLGRDLRAILAGVDRSMALGS